MTRVGAWLCEHGLHRWRSELVPFPAQTPEQADADGIYHPYSYSRWICVCRRCGKGRA